MNSHAIVMEPASSCRISFHTGFSFFILKYLKENIIYEGSLKYEGLLGWGVSCYWVILGTYIGAGTQRQVQLYVKLLHVIESA